MLKLKLQYFGHLMWRADSLEKTLMLGRIEGKRRRGDRRWDGWMASPTQWTWVWTSSGNWWWTGKPGMLQSIGLQRLRHNWATELKKRCQNMLSLSVLPSTSVSLSLWCEHSERSQLSSSQKEKSHQKLNWLQPWSWTVSLQNCEKYISVV